ncbi:hypothetical protein JTB14_010024 [Gonioctena quinquepunctata]|nr:hypothetical protein JTB14_010024 [Gonioctena quinquepunctata]
MGFPLITGETSLKAVISREEITVIDENEAVCFILGQRNRITVEDYNKDYRTLYDIAKNYNSRRLKVVLEKMPVSCQATYNKNRINPGKCFKMMPRQFRNKAIEEDHFEETTPINALGIDETSMAATSNEPKALTLVTDMVQRQIFYETFEEDHVERTTFIDTICIDGASNASNSNEPTSVNKTV